MEMKKCPSCGRDNLLCSVFCCMCGKRFPAENAGCAKRTLVTFYELTELEHDALAPVPAPSPAEDFEIVDGVLKKCWSSGVDVVIPVGVTVIGAFAFTSCKALKTISVPDGLTDIGDYAFGWCEALTDITIPEGVRSIGERAFKFCKSLTCVTIPDSVTMIGDMAFRGCNLLTVKCPAGSFAEKYCRKFGIRYETIGINSGGIPFDEGW